MDVFENFENQLKANPKTIVFTEGTDARILSAASKLLAGKILNVLLLGNPEAVKKAAAEGGFDITGAEICDPTSYPEFDAMVAKMEQTPFPIRAPAQTIRHQRSTVARLLLLFAIPCIQLRIAHNFPQLRHTKGQSGGARVKIVGE